MLFRSGDDGDSAGTDGDNAAAVVGVIDCDATVGANCGDVRIAAANYCGVAVVETNLLAAGVGPETIGPAVIRLIATIGLTVIRLTTGVGRNSVMRLNGLNALSGLAAIWLASAGLAIVRLAAVRRIGALFGAVFRRIIIRRRRVPRRRSLLGRIVCLGSVFRWRRIFLFIFVFVVLLGQH